MKHIFLTGERGVGKSTIISRITSGLDFVPGGFNTVVGRVSEDGSSDHIFIIPYGTRFDEESDIPPVAIRDRSGLVNGNKDGNGNKISNTVHRSTDSERPHFKAYPDVFDTIGTDILRNSVAAKLIIMDELGFMEKDAMVFRTEVLKTLGREVPILGVIKPRSTPFLDCIRANKNVITIEVTEENREAVYEKTREQVCICD